MVRQICVSCDVGLWDGLIECGCVVGHEVDEQIGDGKDVLVRQVLLDDDE